MEGILQKILLKLDELDSRQQEMQSDINGMQSDINDLKSSQVTMQGDITDLKSSQVAMQGDITDLKSSYFTMQHDINELKSLHGEVSKVDEKVTLLTKQMTNFVTEIYTKEIDFLTNKIITIEKGVYELKQNQSS